MVIPIRLSIEMNTQF